MEIVNLTENTSVRRRPHVRNKKLRKNEYDLKIQRKYGITVNELDIIIQELCKQYKCQWSIIAKELQREHGIRLANNAIRERYVSYLDPTIRKEWYSQKEEEELARLFWIQGKRYNQIRDILGNCGRGAIRQSLEYSARRGLGRLLRYINAVNREKPVDISTVERVYSVSAICSQGRTQWKQYRYSYAVLFYFMHRQGDDLCRIPKELASIVYERLISRGTRRLKKREVYYSKINPEQKFTEAILKRRNKHVQWLKRYRQDREYNQSGTYSENQDDQARLQELMLPDIEQPPLLDLDIEMLRLGEEEGISESFDLKDLAFSNCEDSMAVLQQQNKEQQQEEQYSLLSYKQFLSDDEK